MNLTKCFFSRSGLRLLFSEVLSLLHNSDGLLACESQKMRHLRPFIPVDVSRRADSADETRRARVLADWLISIRI